jgi:hypothetical protein
MPSHQFRRLARLRLLERVRRRYRTTLLRHIGPFTDTLSIGSAKTAWPDFRAFRLSAVVECALLVSAAVCSPVQPVLAADRPMVAEAEPGNRCASPPDAPNPSSAAINGFRSARFGMREEQVRVAVRSDFPAAAARLTSTINPAEKTTVLSLTVPDLLPDTGKARISYILGYRSKKLIQVNIVWVSDRTPAGDAAIVAAANSLRDYFVSEKLRSDSVVANRQLPGNTILVFRGSDEQKQIISLVLSGTASGARAQAKPEIRLPPLTLELSYIQDAAHPDVFTISKGQF